MRTLSWISLIVIAIAVLAVIGGYVLLPRFVVSTTSESTSSSGTVCVVPVEGNGVYLHIVSDSSNRSLSGVKLFVTPKANFCFGTFVPTSFSQVSNQSGWADLSLPNLQANYYYQVSIPNFFGRNYSITLPQAPLETTIASINLPSGNLTIQLCQTLNGPTRFSCLPYVNSTDTYTPTIRTITEG